MKNTELNILDEITKKYLLPGDFKKFKKSFNPSEIEITNVHQGIKKRTISRAKSIKYSKTYADKLINFINYCIQKPLRSTLLSNLGEAFNIAGFNDASLKLLLELTHIFDNHNKSLNAYTLLLIGRIYFEKGYRKKSNSFVNQALKIFVKINDKSGLINCYNLLGCNYTENSNLIQGARNYKKCLSILNEKDDPLLRAKIEMNLGVIYLIQCDYKLSLYYSQCALLKLERLNDILNIAMLRYNMGSNYYELGELDRALNEFDKCLIISLNHGFYLNVGRVYQEKAKISIVKEDIKLAIGYWRKAAEIYDKINDPILRIILLKTRGIISRKQRNYSLAEKLLTGNKKLLLKYNNKIMFAENELELGYLYKEWGQTDKALASFRNAAKIYNRINIRHMSEKAESEINNLRSLN